MGACRRQVKLRAKAQVMLLTNLDPQAGLVNGSRGVVVGYMSAFDWRAETQQLLNQVQSHKT